MALKFTVPKLANYLNPGELAKVFIDAHAYAAVASLLIATLSTVAANASAIFPNALVAFVVAQVLGLVIGALKKLPTGSAPTPAVAAATPPAE